MHKFRKLHGLLNILPVFECASRHMSFTKAAAELNLSQPAVSRRINNLEYRLGVQLFERQHNKLVLTQAGMQLNDASILSLSHLNEVINALSHAEKQRSITIACGFSFATMWLQPRFSKLRDYLNNIELHLIASESLNELDPNMVDIRVLWINDPWPNRQIKAFFPEDICIVCSSKLVKAHQLKANDRGLEQQLLSLPLLHYGGGGPEFMDWRSWFGLQNVEYSPPDSTYFYDNYQFLIQAALEGEGIALGLKGFVDSYIDQGTLIQLGPYTRHREYSTFIEFETQRITPQNRKLIFNWFKNTVECDFQNQ